MDLSSHPTCSTLDLERVLSVSRSYDQFHPLGRLLQRLRRALNHSGPEAANEREHTPADVRDHAFDILTLIGDFSDDLPVFAPDILTHDGVTEVLGELRTFLESFCCELKQLCTQRSRPLLIHGQEISLSTSDGCHLALKHIGEMCASADVKINLAALACQLVAQSIDEQLAALKSILVSDNNSGSDPAAQEKS
jgi:hypothetical protein